MMYCCSTCTTQSQKSLQRFPFKPLWIDWTLPDDKSLSPVMYSCEDFFFLLKFFILVVPALTSCTCAPAQSPVSAADQQRHQISLSQVAQTTAVQDGAHRTIAGRLLVYLKISGNLGEGPRGLSVYMNSP